MMKYFSFDVPNAHRFIHLSVILLCCLPLSEQSQNNQDTDFDKSSRLLSRRRRYLTFPEGASFSMAFCLTVGVLGNPQPGIFTWGLNWGLAYELPNETMSLNAFKRVSPVSRPIVARRYRRDLYGKLEMVINDMGYNGRECIFRALCEAAQRLMPQGNSIIEELFKTIFSLPLSRVLPSEPPEHHIYDEAHRSGMEIDGEACHRKYRHCPVSLLDMALGYHSPSHQNVLNQFYQN